nr:thioredoxin family protein [Candidatus Sigynarchaeota archaeon]
MDAHEHKVIIKSFSFPSPLAYIEHIEDASLQAKFTSNLANSHVNVAAVQNLGKIIKENRLKLVVFSAAWCKDCQVVLPTLAKIYQILDGSVPIRVLGGAKVNFQKPPQWHVPSSPPEMNELGIEKIPAILVMDKNSTEILRFYEQPPEGKTLEQILSILIQKALSNMA